MPQRPQASLARRLRTGGLWIVGSRTVGLAVVFFLHIYLARILSTEQFAAFVLVTSVVTFVSAGAMLGLNSLACRYVAAYLGDGDRAAVSRAVRLILSIGILAASAVGLVYWLASGWLTRYLFDMPLLDRSAGFIALWIVFLAISQILAEAFRGLHDMRAAGLLAGLSGGLVANLILLLAVAATHYYIPLDFRLVVLLAGASFVVPIVGSFVWLSRRLSHVDASGTLPESRTPPLTVLTLLGEAVPIMLLQLTSLGLDRFDIWIVGAYCSTEDLAVYGAVRRIAFLGLVPLTLVGLTVISSISELYARNDRRQLEWVLRAGATMSTLAAVAILLLVIPFASGILGLTFGSLFTSGATAVVILCVGQLVRSWIGPCYQALIMTGHQRVAIWSLMGAAPLFAFAPLAAKHFGITGIALIATLSAVTANLLQWVAVRVCLGVRPHASLSPSFLIGLVATLTERAVQVPVAEGDPIDRVRSQSASTSGESNRGTVLLTLSTPDATGAPKMAGLFARSLHRAGHRVILARGRLVGLSDGNRQKALQWLDELESDGIEIVEVDGLEHRFRPRALKGLARLTLDQDAQCLIGFQPRDQLAAMWVGHQTERACVLSAQTCHNFWGSLPVRRFKAAIYGQAMREYASLMICTSEVVRREVIDFGIGSERTSVLPNAIDLSAYDRPRDLSADGSIRREFAVRPDQRLLVNVGRLDVQKGLTHLLEAFSQVDQATHPAKLVIVGNISTNQRRRMARYDRQLKRIVKERGLEETVLFAGWRNDIPEILRAADGYVHSALWEGPPLPLALLEAMAVGCPVILTDCSGWPQGFRNGQDGTIVPAGDSDSLGLAIRRMLECPAERRDEIGRAGRAYVERNNDIDVVGMRFAEMVEGVMTPSPANPVR